jgi:2-keto-4-pentenoate hydratase
VSTDQRVARGMRRQLALRDLRVAAGARQVGWKVGFGAPAALAALGLDVPLVGFLLDTGLLDDGATVSLDGWRNPVLEAEIAVHAGPDATIAGVSAAIELADVHPPPEDPESVLADDVFTRHVMLGPLVSGRPDAAGVTARVLLDGAEVAATDDVTRLVGELGDVVRRTAETLAEHGEQLREGDVLMTGSVFPPLPVAAGQRVAVELEPLGRLGLGFAQRAQSPQ